MIYNRWKNFLHHSIEVVPIELAGRGRRIYEPHYENIHEAVDDAFHLIKDQAKHFTYALFGHSLGGLIAYELTFRLRKNKWPNPAHLFISGRGAPHVPRAKDRKIYHRLPDDEFKKEILELGGTPKEFFEHPELLEVLLPTLKNDFKIAETYKFDDQHKDGVTPMEHDITIMIGKDEEVTAGQMFGWRQHSKQLCSLYYFEGEHFFIHEQTEKIAAIINNTLVHR
jgi:surfactin synthase thioesterase subunit